jgi:steroid delta-isomerase-like uncharacterized protein
VRKHLVLVPFILASLVACEDKPSSPAPAASVSANAATLTTPSASAAPAAPKLTMAELQAKANKAILEAWNSHDPKKVAALFATDGVLKVAGLPDQKGRDAITTDAQTAFTGFPDFKVAYSNIISKGNMQVAEWTINGTNSGEWQGQKATGRPMGVSGVSITTFDDEGLVKEEHRYFDAVNIAQQLDAKAKEGSFRPVAKLPAAAETHVAKDDAVLLAKANEFYAGFNTGKIDSALAAFSDDVAYDDFSTPATAKGKKANKDVLGTYLTAFPDAKQTNQMQLVADGWVVSEGVFSGTNKGPLGGMKASNKSASVHYVDFWQVKDGKIIAGRTYVNSMEMLVQIGAMPAPGAKPMASGAPSGAVAPTPAPKASAK